LPSSGKIRVWILKVPVVEVLFDMFIRKEEESYAAIEN
jgi:hypothetical protein